MIDVVVVGSANLDVVVPVDRHPLVGETVLGGDHRLIPGGKGANQAVAAARLGGRVALVGRTGVDPAASVLRESIGGAGVDISHLLADDSAPSGLAMITVGPDGDNAIVVSPGANDRVSPADVEAAGAVIDSATVLLVQLEIPVATVAAAVGAAGGTTVLDPAPAPAVADTGLLRDVDILVPNESELAILAGAELDPAADLDQIAALARRVAGTVVVTLGRRGALIVEGDEWHHVAAPAVRAVDTTGAGDAFRGALAVALVDGHGLGRAVADAVRVGAAATLRPGAQPSMPTRAEVDQRLAGR